MSSATPAPSSNRLLNVAGTVISDLERLVAIEHLRQLQARYVRYADAGDWRMLVGLFLPEAQFISYGMDGKPQVTMRGRGEIERRVSTSVGKGTALHHLFSYEIDIDSPTKARGLWAMEDRIGRSNDFSRAAAAGDGLEEASRPFRTMHGYGHYHVDYEKVEGTWFIAELKLFRTKLDFTY